jgi:hypothetical protein
VTEEPISNRSDRPDRTWAGRSLLLALAALLALVAAGGSRADGDPASDVLLFQNVSYPYEQPSAGVRKEVEHVVDEIYRNGDRVKVALILRVDDLGAIPSLFGQPREYARFLGIELSSYYVGPLLVVMPVGFGVYDGGRSTAPEDKVLASLTVLAGSSDDLTRTAARTLAALHSAGALRSKDVTAPIVDTHPAFATRGHPVSLRLELFDDSGRSRAVVSVYAGSTVLARIETPSAFGIGTRRVVLRWQVPRRLPSRKLRFCAVAFDGAGNRSRPSCASFLRVS